MTSQIKSQKGSAHLVIIIILIVVILGLLGYVFWQHFGAQSIKKTDDTSKTQSTTDTSTKQPIALSQTFCFTTDSLCIKYPTGWSITKGSDPNFESYNIVSPAGDTVAMVTLRIDGIGCTGPGFNGTVTQVDKLSLVAGDGSPVVADQAVYDTNDIDSSGNIVEDTSSWYAAMGLTASPSNTPVTVGTAYSPGCVGTGGFQAQSTTPENGDTDAGINEFYAVSNKLSSEAAAKAFLTTDTMQTTYRILKSAYYK